MKFTMTKIAAGVALVAMASGAQAVSVTGMTLGDVMDTTGALVADGKAGAFKFNSLNSTTYTGASFFTGDVNGGVIDVTAANAAESFTTGFIFAGSAFQPNTTGPIVADITGGTLSISSLPWAGYYTGAAFQFNMNAENLSVLNLVQTDADEYAYRIAFNHYITSEDDPSMTYAGFTAYWILEGTMSTATAPVPEASTYGMMLAGLGLVGAAVRRRRNVI